MGKYIIYLRRNKVNGMVYVGQTGNFKQREYNWKRLKLPYSKHIDTDRELYGLDNFTVETLAEADSRDEAFELEKRFIADYNSVWPNGYNISTGGGGGSGIKRSEEIKQKLSKANKGEKHPMYGKRRSEETRQKISDAQPKKQVYQYTLDGVLKKVWPSTAECERNGFNSGNISRCCNGGYFSKKRNKWVNVKQTYGYRWSYQPL